MPNFPDIEKSLRWKNEFCSRKLLMLLECHSVRARRAGGERSVEVQLKSRVQVHVVAVQAHDVRSVISLGMDFPERILVEEVVGDDQALFVGGETQVMRSGPLAQIENAQHLRLRRL